MQTEYITEKNITPEIVCTSPWRLTKVKPLKNYIIEVWFIDDGVHGFVEMEKFIMGPRAGVFANLRDINTFNQVHLEYGASTWPGELDLAPDAMYNEIKRNGVWKLS